MARVKLTEPLKSEYQTLFDTCVIRPDAQAEVENHLRSILSQRPRYEAVGAVAGIPWYFIAAVHCLECSLSFDLHLHNGDSLRARTKNVPAGRPLGAPPFTWEVSAQDALGLRGLGASKDWSLAGTLYEIEGYNGWGYRLFHSHVKSPYLWSKSNHYTSGKYIADGRWSDGAVSRQCGAAVLLRRMAEKGIVDFADQPTPEPDDSPLVRYMARKPAKDEDRARGEDLQTWLNTFPGIFVKVDGWTGEKSSDAFKKVTGRFLPGDPRDA